MSIKNYFFANTFTDRVFLSIIIIISVIGFFSTSILFYPYGIHWDSANIINNIITDNSRITNWMGWLYPAIWALLYNISHQAFIIGTFQCFVYWISLCIIAISLFKRNIIGVILYILLSFFPISILFITNITNNALLYTFLLFSFSIYSIYEKTQKRVFFFLFIVLLLISQFIRREACFFVFPIAIYFIFLYLHSKYSKVKSLLISICSICSFAFLNISVDCYISSIIPDYNQINSVQIANLQDLTGMSKFKGELLWPDNIIATEYIEKKDSIMSIINRSRIYDDIDVFFTHGLRRCLLSKKHSKPNLHMSDCLNIYRDNLFLYIQFRGNMIKQLFWASSTYIVNNDFTAFDNTFVNNMKYHNAIQNRLPLSSVRIAWYLLFFFIYYAYTILTKRKRIINDFVFIALFFSIAMVSLSCVSPQTRYLWVYVLLMIDFFIIGIAQHRNINRNNMKRHIVHHNS